MFRKHSERIQLTAEEQANIDFNDPLAVKAGLWIDGKEPDPSGWPENLDLEIVERLLSYPMQEVEVEIVRG